MTFDPDRLKEFLEQSNLDYEQNAQSYRFTCPRCNKPDKLWILKKNGHFVCWYCKEISDFKGRCEYALAELLSQPVSQIRDALYDYLPPLAGELEIDLKEWGVSEEDLIDLGPDLKEIEWPYDSVPLEGTRGAIYLASRGVDPAVAMRYGARWWPRHRRVLFPVIQNGKLYGYQGRATFSVEGTKIPKILTSPGLRREHTLMFHDRLIGSPHAVVCEGPIDAIQADLCGGNVATMGKAVSQGQVELIRAQGVKRVYLALDPDAAAETERLISEFSDMETYILTPPTHRADLGESTPEEVLQAFRGAQPFVAGMMVSYLKWRF